VDVHKYEMPKEKAELKFGFSLYQACPLLRPSLRLLTPLALQGGVVPGSTLRIVDIEGVDQEACCGTHCDNTAEIGFVRILRSIRISDGIVRLYFVAGDRAITQTNFGTRLANQTERACCVADGVSRQSRRCCTSCRRSGR
jgi:alanyl-tRNA synthetase